MTKRYILLETLEEDWFYRSRFMTWADDKEDHTKLKNGKVVYRVIGYADTVQEAQIKLYGKAYD